MRTSDEDRMKNRSISSMMKRLIKELEACTTRADAESRLKNVVSIIDKVSQSHIIHKNKAANLKSRLTTFVNGLSG